jgi:hypothetical protein
MVWAIALAFCWNPDNAHKTEPRVFRRKAGAAETFADAKLRQLKTRNDLASLKLSEVFERNGAAKRKYRVRACAALANYLCGARNLFYQEALSSGCSLIVLRTSRCSHA